MAAENNSHIGLGITKGEKVDMAPSEVSDRDQGVPRAMATVAVAPAGFSGM